MGCAFSFGEWACWALGSGVVSRTPFFRCETAAYRDPSAAWDRLSDDPTSLRMTVT
jgi:hypothetical protein